MCPRVQHINIVGPLGTTIPDREIKKTCCKKKLDGGGVMEEMR